jgi:hypothetical protein
MSRGLRAGRETTVDADREHERRPDLVGPLVRDARARTAVRATRALPFELPRCDDVLRTNQP